MTWVLYALLAATGKAVNQIATKPLLGSVGVVQISVVGQVLFAAIMLPCVLWPGLIDIPADPGFHRAAWINIVLTVIAIVLIIEAIRVSDLSYAMPFLALSPMFALLTGWVIMGERVSAVGVAGTVAVALGALGIGARSALDWLTLGGKRVLADRGVRMVILVAVIYSVSSVYDKEATLRSDPFTYVFYSSIFRALLLLGVWFVLRALKRVKPVSLRLKKTHLLLLLLLGVSFAGEAVTQMQAMTTGLVAYVLAIKRLSILMTSIVGVTLFGEEFTWYRLAGAGLIVFGAALLGFA